MLQLWETPASLELEAIIQTSMNKLGQPCNEEGGRSEDRMTSQRRNINQIPIA